MKINIFIITLFFIISCEGKKIQKDKQIIEELELSIQTLENKIQYYKSMNLHKINEEDSFIIKDIILKNDKKTLRKFFASGEFFHNQKRYLFLVLNMFLINKDKSFSRDVFQALTNIYYYKLTNELKDSNLYYFTQYFYALNIYEDSIKMDNPLDPNLNHNNIKSPKYYLSKAYE